jgi:hypothetical protein
MLAINNEFLFAIQTNAFHKSDSLGTMDNEKTTEVYCKS